MPVNRILTKGDRRYKINNYTETELINYLHKLSIIDEELKLGKCLEEMIFPIFIANL